jgi:hypothetical protein
MTIIQLSGYRRFRFADKQAEPDADAETTCQVTTEETRMVPAECGGSDRLDRQKKYLRWSI